MRAVWGQCEDIVGALWGNCVGHYGALHSVSAGATKKVTGEGTGRAVHRESIVAGRHLDHRGIYRPPALPHKYRNFGCNAVCVPACPALCARVPA